VTSSLWAETRTFFLSSSKPYVVNRLSAPWWWSALPMGSSSYPSPQLATTSRPSKSTAPRCTEPKECPSGQPDETYEGGGLIGALRQQNLERQVINADICDVQVARGDALWTSCSWRFQ
jgi:hypothetical protein